MALTDVVLNPGSGGNLIGTDRIAGVDYEVVKVAFGDAGSLTLVSPLNPLPVQIYQNTSFQVLVAVAGQDVFTFVGVPSDYANYLLFANGWRLEPLQDYTTVGNDVTLVFPRDLNDRITFNRLQ